MLMICCGVGILLYGLLWIIWYIGLEDKSEYFVKTRKFLAKLKNKEDL